MPSDSEARNILLQAFSEKFGREPNLGEIQALQAMTKRESSYGEGWKGAGIGSNNWGAIQGGIASGTCLPNSPPPICSPGQGFLYGDTKPTSTPGVSLNYQCCYRVYGSPLEGAKAAVRMMYISNGRDIVRQAAEQGDLFGVSAGLYDTGYYEGFGPDRNTRISGHHKWLSSAIDEITSNLGEPSAFAGRSADRGLGVVGIVGLFGAVGVGLLALSQKR